MTDGCCLREELTDVGALPGLRTTKEDRLVRPVPLRTTAGLLRLFLAETSGDRYPVVRTESHEEMDGNPLQKIGARRVGIPSKGT